MTNQQNTPKTKPEKKPVIIKRINTVIEQDARGVQKRTTTTYTAPAPKKTAAAPVKTVTVKKPIPKVAPKTAPATKPPAKGTKK